jgi:UDP-GlcNAc:undecaprenyl-phosphate GlcNAc-1-phosphate transferase
MSYLIFIAAFAITLQLLLVLRRLAPRIGLLDTPGGRKDHEGAVPLVGGLAMFIGFAFSLLLLQESLGPLRALVAGATLVVVVGVLDDLNELSSLSRFVVQIAAALMMVFWGGVELTDLGFLGSAGHLVELGLWSIPLTVFSTVGVINALNMIDGVDGLAGSVTALALAALILVALLGGDGVAASVLGTLLATVAAFLLLNLRLPWQPRARVFMGDAGSMFLGFVLAWYLIDCSQGEDRLISPVTALWLLGVPLIDTVTSMLRRILKRSSPFKPDREHFHHILQLAGFSPRATLGIMFGVSLLMAAVGLGAHYAGVPEWVMFYAFLALFAIYFLVMRRAWRVMRFLKRSLDRRHLPDRRQCDDPHYTGVERRRGVDRRVGP